MSLFAELGMRYPIIQAPMAGVQNTELAMAVTGVGALGSLPAAMLGTAELRKALEQLAASGPGPFNINFFCHRQREPDPAEEHRWQQALAPFLCRVRCEYRCCIEWARPRPLQRRACSHPGRVQPRRSQLPLRPAGARVACQGKSNGSKSLCQCDHGSRSEVAGPPWRRCHHSPGAGGGRPSRSLPESGSQLATRHLYAVATDSGGSGFACHRCRGHCRWQGDSRPPWHWGPAQSRWERHFSVVTRRRPRPCTVRRSWGRMAGTPH